MSDLRALTAHLYNNIVVIMSPALTTVVDSPWAILPPGFHPAGLDEVEAVFATNPRRRALFGGLIDAALKLQMAGCSAIFLDGSYVSGKPKPGDYDACWDWTGVDPAKLDPVFLDFSNGRAAQKAAYQGEFFPAQLISVDIGKPFIEFFQKDRFTGGRKGILSISLTADPVLLRKVQP